MRSSLWNNLGWMLSLDSQVPSKERCTVPKKEGKPTWSLWTSLLFGPNVCNPLREAQILNARATLLSEPIMFNFLSLTGKLKSQQLISHHILSCEVLYQDV
jgi:hypothetical protein